MSALQSLGFALAAVGAIDAWSPSKMLSFVQEVVELERGCDCEYDYRCGRCDRVIRARSKAADLLMRE